MTSLRAFLRLIGRAPRGQVIVLGLLMLVASVTDGFGFLLLVPLLNLIAAPAKSGPVSWWLSGVSEPVSIAILLCAFVGLMGLRSIIQHARETRSLEVQHMLVDNMRLETFTALLGAEWRWLSAQRQSDHANLMVTNISRVGVGLNFGISLCANLVAGAAHLAVAFALAPVMASLVLVTGGAVFVLLSGQRRRALSLGHQSSAASRALHSNVQESLAAIKLAKILGSEQRQIRLLSETMGQLRNNQYEFVASTSASRGLFHFVGAALLAIYIWVGLHVLDVPVATLLTLVLVFGRLVPMFMMMHQQYHHWLHALPALGEAESLLEDCRKASEPEGAKAGAAIAIHDAVTLDRVTQFYADRQRPALADVTLRLRARTTTAVIGSSGAGKSTLADVVMGLLPPDSGQLAVDGVTLAGAERLAWRKSVAYVPQDTYLFHDTIRNNLLWARSDASDEDIHEALRQAAADFVHDLPHGLDTLVGDGGQLLSGGERQRLALARALLQRPSLLILDEATSALDLESEARIREAIEQLHGDLTILIIGHRLPTLEHADHVVKLDHGAIVAAGTWDQIRSGQAGVA